MTYSVKAIIGLLILFALAVYYTPAQVIHPINVVGPGVWMEMSTFHLRTIAYDPHRGYYYDCVSPLCGTSAESWNDTAGVRVTWLGNGVSLYDCVDKKNGCKCDDKTPCPSHTSNIYYVAQDGFGQGGYGKPSPTTKTQVLIPTLNGKETAFGIAFPDSTRDYDCYVDGKKTDWVKAGANLYVNGKKTPYSGVMYGCGEAGSKAEARFSPTKKARPSGK